MRQYEDLCRRIVDHASHVCLIENEFVLNAKNSKSGLSNTAEIASNNI